MARRQCRGHFFHGAGNRHRLKFQRFEEFNKRRFLLFDQIGIAGHFVKPSHAVAMLDDTENPLRAAASRIGPGNVVKLRGLAAGFNIFRRLLQFIVRHHRQADLSAPAVDVRRVGASHAGQRNNAYVRLFAVCTRHFERAYAHLARRNFDPARRRLPRQLRCASCGRRSRLSGRGRNVRMSGRQFRVWSIRRQRRSGLLRGLILVLGDAIDFGFVAVAASDQQQRHRQRQQPDEFAAAPFSRMN